jgi:hypothetical protein
MSTLCLYTNAELRHLIRMLRLAPVGNTQARRACNKAVDYYRCRKAFGVKK